MSLSIKEFKAWMKGVEDMHGENWSPNKAQWKKIREKLELLDEEIIPQYNVTPFNQPFMPQNNYIQHNMPSMDPNVHVPDGESTTQYLNGDKPSFL